MSGTGRAEHPRVAEITREGLCLLEEGGAEALSMRRLAGRLGIKAPSLYKHIPDKEGLAALIADAALADLGRVVAEAAADKSPAEAIRAMGHTYRTYGHQHPSVYQFLMAQPLPTGVHGGPGESLGLVPLLATLAGDPVERRAAARAVWAFVHGFVSLELVGRFPPGADLERAFARGLEALAQAFAADR